MRGLLSRIEFQCIFLTRWRVLLRPVLVQHDQVLYKPILGYPDRVLCQPFLKELIMCYAFPSLGIQNECYADHSQAA